MTLLDWLTLASYVALNIDIILQIRRIHHTKSSNDLSIVGMTIRCIAVLIILAKFISISDVALIIGQVVVTLTFILYFGLAIVYFKHRKKKLSSKR
jgi:hypothetical protein